MTYHQILLCIYCTYLVFFSLVAFVAYGKDKSMAKKGTPVRIKEKTLLFLTVFGGGIGACAGRLFFRHKTNKSYFTLTVFLSLISQLAVLALMIALAI